MGHSVFRLDELEWAELDDGRRLARISDALEHSRATFWRYPPGTHGRRHRDLGQEEVFVVLQGRVTMLLGDPPERVDAPAGSAVAVELGTALQVRNESDEEAVLFIYGAPPVSGQAEFLDDAG